MTSNRNFLIGGVVVAVVAIAYFMLSANDATPPQSPTPAATQPKQ
jgi:hypothetical protein